MVKLLDIYNLKEETLIKETDHKSKITNIDPETGAVTWDIIYQSDLNTTYKAFQVLVKRLDDLYAEDAKDMKIKGFLDGVKNLKNKFSRYRKQIEKQRRRSSGKL